jgi:small subunit ribosomal protein S10
MAAKKQEKRQDRIRIRLRSYDYKMVDTATDDIINAVKRAGALVRGPVPLPARRERFDLLRSPHVDKKSREQIEIRTYSRLIDILDPTQKTTDSLMRLDLPAGVDADIKL